MALDESCALNFFDCLVPHLKEHRKLKILKGQAFSIDDFRARLEVLRIEKDLQAQQFPQLRQENKDLRLEIEQLKSEFQIVDWYLQVMEEGRDTKQLVRDYARLKDDYRLLKKQKDKADEKIKRHKQEQIRLTQQMQKTLQQLEKQQENVVKPLIEECSKREKERQFLLNEIKERTKNLKILYSMIKSPKMCDLLYKAEQKHISKERLK